MRYIMLFFLIIFTCSCSSVKKIGDDYFDAEDLNKNTIEDAVESIKVDYLNIKETRRDRSRDNHFKMMALDNLLKSEYKDLYKSYSVRIDVDTGMPQTIKYIFILFDPLITKPEISYTKYLVVIRRLDEKIVYSDVFTPPQGDPFYRYSEVINKIQN